jgi:hypothetical protein
VRVTAKIYVKRARRWRFLREISDDLDVNAGLGDDYGYFDFAMVISHQFADHRVEVQDPSHSHITYIWRTGRYAGQASVTKMRASC